MTAAADDDLILEITNLSKSFGPVRALREVEFQLRRGEIHALAGENGAGKSTLMNIIDGILRPDSGEIRLDGQPVTITSPAMAQTLGIGFVHQEIALCPDITVAENIFMAATNSSRALLMDFRGLERRARRDPATPRRHRSRRAGALALDLAAAAGRDRQGPDTGLPRADPRRADRRADRARGADPVRDHAHAGRSGHLDHLHLASHGGDLRQLRPRHRSARRPVSSRR